MLFMCNVFFFENKYFLSLIIILLFVFKCSVESYNILNCKGKEWKEVLKEWLNLFKLMKNPKAFYQSQFFKDVLQYRLVKS